MGADCIANDHSCIADKLLLSKQSHFVLMWTVRFSFPRWSMIWRGSSSNALYCSMIRLVHICSLLLVHALNSHLEGHYLFYLACRAGYSCTWKLQTNALASLKTGVVPQSVNTLLQALMKWKETLTSSKNLLSDGKCIQIWSETKMKYIIASLNHLSLRRHLNFEYCTSYGQAKSPKGYSLNITSDLYHLFVQRSKANEEQAKLFQIKEIQP